MLGRRPHLGGTEGRAAARRGDRQGWDVADYGFCAMGRASGSAQRMRDDSAGFVPIEGRVHVYGRDPYFHIDRASGGFRFTPAVRQTVPPVRSRAPPVAIENWPDRQFLYENRHDREYPATRPYSKHPTRAASCAIILANSGHASLSVSIV